MDEHSYIYTEKECGWVKEVSYHFSDPKHECYMHVLWIESWFKYPGGKTIELNELPESLRLFLLLTEN